MTAARRISFRLNGAPVTADVKPHHNLVELLQAQFGSPLWVASLETFP
jgi:aerobic-type carbon monoxide dehydrogenase small subunit (CoxS/CutS family)